MACTYQCELGSSKVIWVRDSDLSGRVVHVGYLNRDGWPLCLMVGIGPNVWAASHAGGCTKIHGGITEAQHQAEQWLCGTDS